MPGFRYWEGNKQLGFYSRKYGTKKIKVIITADVLAVTQLIR